MRKQRCNGTAALRLHMRNLKVNRMVEKPLSLFFLKLYYLYIDLIIYNIYIYLTKNISGKSNLKVSCRFLVAHTRKQSEHWHCLQNFLNL